MIDRERLDRINLVNEAVTIANAAAVRRGRSRSDMVATVKIIPFAVPGRIWSAASPSRADGGPLSASPHFRPRPVGLIQTRLPGLKESVLDKTMEIMNGRLAALGCRAGGGVALRP